MNKIENNQPNTKTSEKTIDCSWSELLCLVTIGTVIFPVVGALLGTIVLALHEKDFGVMILLFSWRTYAFSFFFAGIPGFFLSCILSWLLADFSFKSYQNKTRKFNLVSFSAGFGIPFLGYSLITGWIGLEWIFMLLIAGGFSGILTGWVMFFIFNRYMYKSYSLGYRTIRPTEPPTSVQLP
jgi:hypothetical protein